MTSPVNMGSDGQEEVSGASADADRGSREPSPKGLGPDGLRSTSGETPWSKGPWELGRERKCYVRINAPESRYKWTGLAKVVVRSRGTSLPGVSDEGEANARLIAAAPELAEALAEVLSALAWLNCQAENAMATSAGCATTHGDDGGGLQMLNSIASDIGINCSMQSDKIAALLAKIGGAS